MLFPTIQFAIFFLIVMTANWLLMPNRRAWQLAMLGASWWFYAAWDWRFLGLLIGSTLANQVFAVLIHRAPDGRRRSLVIAAVAANLGILGWFKYYGFFASSLVNMARSFGIDLSVALLDITLPVGISFFTFQALSYVLDVYRRTQEPTTMVEFAVFVAFFPQLVAGPIVRSSEFLPQLVTPRDPRKVEAVEAFLLICGGLFKKVVVANTLATSIVDPVFANPNAYSAPEVIAAVYAYAVQIFADFSGYTDIAIGVALLLGFRFPQNFDRPYTAVSLGDFWRRWHLTLSRWLRDYLYIPLGGSRGGEARTYRNLVITMALGGLWHGAAWTFVIWGLLHGLGLAWERWRPAPGRNPWLGRFLTFHLVCAGWIFFRADSLETVGHLFARLVYWTVPTALDAVTVTLILGALAAQFVGTGPRTFLRMSFARLRPIPMALSLAAFLLMLDGIGPEGVAPFIYFQF